MTAKWDGFPISYPDAVEGLFWLEDRYRREVEARAEGSTVGDTRS